MAILSRRAPASLPARLASTYDRPALPTMSQAGKILAKSRLIGFGDHCLPDRRDGAGVALLTPCVTALPIRCPLYAGSFTISDIFVTLNRLAGTGRGPSSIVLTGERCSTMRNTVPEDCGAGAAPGSTAWATAGAGAGDAEEGGR